MSDLAYEWMKSTSPSRRQWARTDSAASIPYRKALLSGYSEDREDASVGEFIYAKAARNSIPHNAPLYRIRVNDASERPRYLVVIFALGILVFLIGGALLGVGFFVTSNVMSLVSSLFLALGSTAVIIALLRGQDLDERLE